MNPFLRKVRARVLDEIESAASRRRHHSNALVQAQLIATYQQMRRTGHFLDSPADAGFRCFSQHEEDGLLLYVLSLIGTTNKVCVEMCCGIGRECNTANLLINHRWTGLLLDGSERNVREARRFFHAHADTRTWPPDIIQAWLTRSNLNELIGSRGIIGEIDLLSLDVDGNDLWFWQELDIIQPRVVILEINCLWGAERAVSTPYADDFVAEFTSHGSDYAGASLPAFVSLGKKKGYHLVATNAYATNAIFLRNDAASSLLPEIAAADCFHHPRAKFSHEVRLPNVRDRDWVEVD